MLRWRGIVVKIPPDDGLVRPGEGLRFLVRGEQGLQALAQGGVAVARAVEE